VIASTALVTSGLLSAQTPPVPEARLDMRRAQATRAELQASLIQIDSILQSPGYSSRIREAKRREADLIRERLVDGDLQVGDSVRITVLNEAQLSGAFVVGAGRVLTLPGLPDIPLRGILRSEAEGYLTERLSQYIRGPSVRVQTSIRMSIMGAVGRPGFYQVPADFLVSDAIMLAGGPAGAADPNRTVIRRTTSVLYSQDQVRDALVRGVTLDQLNLRAGDEMVVDQTQVQRRSTLSIVTFIGLVTSITYLITRIF